MNSKRVRGFRAGVTLLIASVILTGTPGFVAQAVDVASDDGTGKHTANQPLESKVDAAVSLHRAAPAPAGPAATKAASPADAEELAGTYPIHGIIDPDAVRNSDDPGVLVPLAQGASPVSHWIEAVNAAGPTTPLSDPSFEGTVFIPDDKAFEVGYRQLSRVSSAGFTAADVFADIKTSELAAQLNSLTVPGVVLKLADLKQGKLLSTSDGGVLKVLGARLDNTGIKLQHSPSGATFTVQEHDLQLGSAVGHVVDRLLPPAKPLATAAATEQAAISTPEGRYASAMSVLLDPALHLSQFARLTELAGLSSMLAGPETQLTLFAPSSKAMQSFLAQLAPSALEALHTNVTLADLLVSAHLVAGVAMGTKALEALPTGQTKSQAGAVMYVQKISNLPLSAPVSLTGYIPEQAQLSPGHTLSVDGAALVTSDIVGGRAVVHIIDKVWVPADVAQQLNIPATLLELSELNLAGRASNGGSGQVAGIQAVQLAGLAALICMLLT